MRPYTRKIALSAVGLLLLAAALPARAQLRFQLVPPPPTAGPNIAVEAVAGQPFGVGRITLELPKEALPEPLGIDGLTLSDAEGRVFFPAMHSPRVGALLKEILNADTPLTTGGPVRQQVGGLLRGLLVDRPPQATLYFLFRGAGPLNLKLQAKQAYPLQVVPRQDDFAAPPAGRLVAGVFCTSRAIAAQARLSAAGGELSDVDAGAATESALAAAAADRFGLRAPGT